MDLVTVSVPGRICLAGESLDWMIGGTSLTAAIPLRTRVTVRRAAADTDSLVLRSGPPINRTRYVSPSVVAARTYDGDVLDHMLAAAAAALPDPADLADLAGTVLTVSTDLPVAGGLSSSAAVTLGVISALMTLHQGSRPSLETVQTLAHRAESDLGTGAGWLDFLACTRGGVCRVSAGESPRAEPIARSLGLPIVIVDTLRHRSTADVLAANRARYLAGEPPLLSYLTEAAALVDHLASVLAQPAPAYQDAGSLLNSAHTLLRDLLDRSTPLTEECITRMLRAGAYGAKLTGHGGCLFALVPPACVTAVLASVDDLPVRAIVLMDTDPFGLMWKGDGAPDQGERIYQMKMSSAAADVTNGLPVRPSSIMT